MLSSTEIYINNFLKKHGCNTQMQSGWGMCELGATAATTVFSKHTKLGSVGIPMPLAIISAFDVDSNEEKPYNERGELRVKTPCAMKGYFNRPESTKEFFKTDLNQNVWGCTGDIGYVDEDGFVYVLGRASDYFIDPDAVKHYLFDIENVILENESVDICEVITVDSKKYGREVPIAHLILSKNFNGDTNTLIETLDAKCKENLPRYAVPIGYKIRDSFAVKPNGKRDTTSIKSETEGIFCVVDGIVTTVNVN